MENIGVRPNYEQMSWLIFQEEFQSEEDCYAWLYKTRWPRGFVCRECGGKEYWLILTQQRLYKCRNCRNRVSLTSGTIFHKTRTPLLKWFMLIFRMATSKTGVSMSMITLIAPPMIAVMEPLQSGQKGVSDTPGN
jgi:hypothetical protein